MKCIICCGEGKKTTFDHVNVDFHIKTQMASTLAMILLKIIYHDTTCFSARHNFCSNLLHSNWVAWRLSEDSSTSVLSQWEAPLLIWHPTMSWRLYVYHLSCCMLVQYNYVIDVCLYHSVYNTCASKYMYCSSFYVSFPFL